VINNHILVYYAHKLVQEEKLIMKKCLKIHVQLEKAKKNQKQDKVLADFVEKQAKKLDLEGSIQMDDVRSAIIFVYGQIDNVEHFVDAVYKGTQAIVPEIVEVEPALGEKDFRGIFRIIE
jgi:acylphosphatase